MRVLGVVAGLIVFTIGFCNLRGATDGR